MKKEYEEDAYFEYLPDPDEYDYGYDIEEQIAERWSQDMDELQPEDWEYHLGGYDLEEYEDYEEDIFEDYDY